MKAVGFTCGVGSMLHGARLAGFEILANVEYRPYYHHRDSQGRNTFEQNFLRAFFKKSIKDLTREEVKLVSGCDLALGHP